MKVKVKDIECLVIHHNDADGISAAGIVGYFEGQFKYFEETGFYKKCHMYKMNYGYSVPWNLIERAQLVYMVDFGLQPFDDMVKVKDIVGYDNFIWIDHHKTAIEDMKNSGQSFKGIQRIGDAGCELTWEWFTADKNYPVGIQLLGRYDVWDLDFHEDVLIYQTGIRFKSPEADNTSFWKKVIENDAELHEEILNVGEICFDYQTQLNESYCKSHSFDLIFENHRFLAANAMSVNSQLFDSKFNHMDYDAVLTFGFTNGGWTVSMYTDKENVDVGSIAKKYGGGGHMRAAGFQCQIIPFTLPYKIK